MIAAGRLDRRVTLQAPTVTRGALGGKAETWVDLATVWAQVRPLSGRAATIAKQVQSQASLAITIRWRDDLSDTLRVLLDDGRTATVSWHEEIGRRKAMILYCEVIHG